MHGPLSLVDSMALVPACEMRVSQFDARAQACGFRRFYVAGPALQDFQALRFACKLRTSAPRNAFFSDLSCCANKNEHGESGGSCGPTRFPGAATNCVRYQQILAILLKVASHVAFAFFIPARIEKALALVPRLRRLFWPAPSVTVTNMGVGWSGRAPMCCGGLCFQTQPIALRSLSRAWALGVDSACRGMFLCISFTEVRLRRFTQKFAGQRARSLPPAVGFSVLYPLLRRSEAKDGDMLGVLSGFKRLFSEAGPAAEQKWCGH